MLALAPTAALFLTLLPGQDPQPARLAQPTGARALAMPMLASPGPALADFEALPPSPPYGAAEQGFRAEHQAWIAEIQRLAASGTATSFPPAPDAAWYPRMRALADLGDLRARLWCLRRFEHHPVSAEQRLPCWRGEAFSLATALHADAESARELTSAALAARRHVGDAELSAWFDYLWSVTTNPSVQRDVAASCMVHFRNSSVPEVAQHALQWEEILLERWPESTEAQRLLGRRFAEQHLQVGSTAPEFVGKDVDGKEIRLSAYRGKVVVLDFWGFW